jgi:diacylglycerol O-acyltransferase / wax synthase
VELLRPLDAAFLAMETPRTPMHMGSIGIFEAGPLRDGCGRLRMDDIRAEVQSRLHLVPKLRKRVRFPLASQSAPLWVDDPHFDITAHVLHSTLSDPGDEDQLLARCAALMSKPLDRDRPLWQIWVIDGLSDDRVALMEMLHHSMADGLAGVELASVLLDLAPRSAHAAASSPWRPLPPPGDLSVAAGQLGRLGSSIGRLVAATSRSLRHPSALSRALRNHERAFTNLASAGLLPSRCSLNVPVGHDRGVLAVRRSMEDLQRAEHHFGVTVNDLLLTAIAAGLHDLFASRGEATDGRTARILVPVATDHHEDRALGNRVSVMVVRVPVGDLDPVRRLRAVAAEERSCKDHHQALATELVLSSLDAWLPAAVSAASGLVHHQPFVNLVVTNVPGPAVPLYVLGARMLEVIPLVPLGGNLSVGVAALSYDGQLGLGIMFDPVACPDADVLAAGIRRCFEELATLARRGPTGVAQPLPA